MNWFSNTSTSKQEKFLLGFAVFVSLALSFFITSQESVINTDAICYLLSAQEIGRGGLNSGMHLCGQASWPFYSLLISFTQRFTHLSFETSANVLNALFSIISVTTFILIIKTLSASLRLMWFATATILLSHTFNGVREYIIRDHGFWAFYLLSIFLMLRYLQNPRFSLAILWGVSLIIATLFRLEGAIFLLGLPTLVLFNFRITLPQRIIQFLNLHLLTIVLASLLACYLLIHPHEALNHLGRFNELLQQFRHGLIMMMERYQATKLALGNHVLTSYSVNEAGFVTNILYLGWYVGSVLANLSWIYALLFLYAIYHRLLRLDSSSRLVIYAYIVINIIVTVAFLMEHMFLSKRYLIALSLTLMIWVPYAMQEIWQRAQLSYSRFSKSFAIVVACIVSGAALGGILNFGYSKEYLHQAGIWLAENLSADALLYSNDLQVMYYADHFGRDVFQKEKDFAKTDFIDPNNIVAYDYLALRIDKKAEQQILLSKLGAVLPPPLKAFSNNRGDKVVIYKLNRNARNAYT